MFQRRVTWIFFVESGEGHIQTKYEQITQLEEFTLNLSVPKAPQNFQGYALDILTFSREGGAQNGSDLQPSNPGDFPKRFPAKIVCFQWHFEVLLEKRDFLPIDWWTPILMPPERGKGRKNRQRFPPENYTTHISDAKNRFEGCLGYLGDGEWSQKAISSSECFRTYLQNRVSHI